ncbi:glycosyltransferase family 4 protein [Paenibacillus chartarius]|uniref:Glycosyltransferase family 4 protein n=1 Tax=Paenibacillus chartarius TaxID=747481 RepID=A0ABV6DJB6_9BACL
MIICTMATGSHLARAKVLAKSVKKHHPDALMVLCYLEKKWHREVSSSKLFDRKMLVRDIEVPNFHKFIFTRRVNEASYALKGHFLRYLMKAYPSETNFLFLDADTKLFGRMEELEQALREHPIVLTPHLLQDADLTYLQHGLYNVGFLGLRRSEESERFLRWWTDRTDRYCYANQYANGLFYEQNWLNLAPAYFDVQTLDHPGYNLAYWNLHERGQVERLAPGRYLVNGVPLRLAHFSHVEGDMLSSMNAHIGDKKNGLYVMRSIYLRELYLAGHQRLRRMPWSYNYFEDGKPISQVDRSAFEAQPELQLKYGNPYQDSSKRIERGNGKLRIVQVLSNFPNALPVPPTNQGGTEKIVYELTEELVRRGHEVYLYASRGSKTAAALMPYPKGMPENRIGSYVVSTMPKNVDIIHDHSFKSSVGRRFLKTPTVCTHHLPHRNPVKHSVYVSKRALQITGDNRGLYVYNGINPDEYQFSEEKRGYMLFIGRLLWEKGILHALDVAERTGKRLIIAGPVKDQKLFDKVIAPRIRANPRIEYVGAVGGQRKQDLLKFANVLLFPTIWEEPFGLVMIEAMACGTPVLALDNGAVPEVLAGFPNLICRNVNEMVQKVLHEPMPSPAALRNYVIERFTTKKMADRYLEVYSEIIAGRPGQKVPKLLKRGKRPAGAARIRRAPGERRPVKARAARKRQGKPVVKKRAAATQRRKATRRAG